MNGFTIWLRPIPRSPKPTLATLPAVNTSSEEVVSIITTLIVLLRPTGISIPLPTIPSGRESAYVEQTVKWPYEKYIYFGITRIAVSNHADNLNRLHTVQRWK